MALASLDDINKYLPTDKVEATDSNTLEFQLTAERSIKGMLATILEATTLSSWSSYTLTPGEIREIAGKLIAALIYRKRYSEDSAQVAPYAQQLYNEAMYDLSRIRSGDIRIIDLPEGVKEVPSRTFTSLDFLPNDTSTPAAFRMDLEF